MFVYYWILAVKNNHYSCSCSVPTVSQLQSGTNNYSYFVLDHKNNTSWLRDNQHALSVKDRQVWRRHYRCNIVTQQQPSVTCDSSSYHLTGRQFLIQSIKRNRFTQRHKSWVVSTQLLCVCCSLSRPHETVEPTPNSTQKFTVSY